VLPREGFRTVVYDARGHGESEPAPGGEGYGYPQLVEDLERIVDERAGGGPFLLGGHSMGAHTVVAYALEHPERIAGLVVIGPVYRGALDDETLEKWDRRGDALAEGGVEGFLAAIEAEGIDPAWHETVLRFTRARMEAHRHPEAVAEALHELPRSRPFEAMSELEFLEVPALVVASHDVADPGHPYAVAEEYAARLPQAELVSEPGEQDSPLAWQGGRLSREIARFAAGEDVRARLAAGA